MAEDERSYVRAHVHAHVYVHVHVLVHVHVCVFRLALHTFIESPLGGHRRPPLDQRVGTGGFWEANPLWLLV